MGYLLHNPNLTKIHVAYWGSVPSSEISIAVIGQDVSEVARNMDLKFGRQFESTSVSAHRGGSSADY